MFSGPLECPGLVRTIPWMPRTVSEPPVCKHLDGLVELMGQVTGKALTEFDEDAIHKARVTTRRLKAAMELLEPVLEKDSYRPMARMGRRLRRRLGPLRDIDVMLGHLEKIKPTMKFAPAVEWFRDRLHEQRDKSRLKSSHKSSPAKVLVRLKTWPMLRQEIVAAGERVDPLLAESVHLRLDAFTEHANHLGGTDPHELRIAGKSLRYTLELAKAQGHRLPAKILRAFKRMQDNLGEWHDHVVLAERVMQACIDCDLPLHDAAMQRQVLGLVDFSMKRAQLELERFGRLWEETGPELSLSIRGSVPLTHPAAAAAPSMEQSPAATEPKTGPDPVQISPPPAPEAAPQAPPSAA